MRVCGQSHAVQPPVWSVTAQLVYGLAVVDALNATHLMIQVIWRWWWWWWRWWWWWYNAMMFTLREQFLEGATGKVLDESVIVQGKW